MDLAGWTRQTFARLAIGSLLLTAGTIARVGRAIRAGRIGPGTTAKHAKKIRLLVVGTFYNPNWIRSHLFPLAHAANVREVRVVCSQPGQAYRGLVYDVPPAWLRGLMGRSISKILWFFVVACRRRPDAAMGYHIMPNGLLCLMASGLLGCRSIYQMTGGPVQFIGGGWGSENPLLHMQGRPSRVLENWMFGMGRLLDMIVVRGNGAREFLHDRRICGSAPIVTGSVDVERFCPGAEPKCYDIACVSRLMPFKGLDLFLEVIALLKKSGREIRAAVVGDGVMRDSLLDQARQLGIEANVAFLGQTDDVPSILAKARLFMLISASEGLSIAMLEAMSAGLPVLVSDVGELRDAIDGGRAGILLSDRRPACMAEVVSGLLADPVRLEAMGAAARQVAVERYSLQAVAARWAAVLNGGERSNGSPESPAGPDPSALHAAGASGMLAGHELQGRRQDQS